MIRAVSLALAAAACLAATAPESRLEQFFRLRKEAQMAAADKDYAKAEAALEGALRLFPYSPGSLVMSARMEATQGKAEEAIAHLAAYADLGLVWDVAGDEVLAPLAARGDFAPVAGRLKSNAAPVGDLELMGEIPSEGQVVEGIIWRGGGWFISSVGGRKILQIAEKTDSYPTTGGPVGAIFGITAQMDGRDGYIWAAEADGPGIPGSTAPAATALLKIDFFSGTLLARYPVPDDGKRHQLGDVVVTGAGDVIASDSAGGRLYRLKKGARALDLLLASNALGSPQGLANCGKDVLLVADYSTGLHRLDLKTGRLEMVGGKPVALAGSDGLVEFDNPKGYDRWSMTYVVTQNGIAPARILQLKMSDDCRRITAVSTLAANQPELDDITLATSLSEGVVFISGSGWAGVDQQGKPLKDAPKSRPRIYQVSLD